MSYDELKQKLSSLYHLRNNYFDLYPINQASLKQERIREKIEEVVREVHSARIQHVSGCGIGSGDTPNVDDLAVLCWIEGKARNAAGNFDPMCQEMLTKALKLNPHLGNTTDLYVQLGECLWKKSDKEGAKLSFEQCLKSSDKEIVKFGKRNLSIILRQIAAVIADGEQIGTLKEQSVTLAKEAIQLDYKDGYSWYILGNAYFSQFFHEGQKWEVMKLALQAYKNAFKDSSSKHNCDLHFNQAVLFKFQEKFQKALQSFQFAVKLDPVWKEAKSECHRLETILTQMNGLVSNNGGLKRKQFEKILSKFDNSQLGPFLNASVKDPKSDRAIQLFKCTLTDLKTVSASEEIVDFMSLLNADKVCLLKVIAEVGSDSSRPPYHCIAVDEQESLCVVSVFNAANTFHLQRSDSIAIAQPFVTTHNFTFQPSSNPNNNQSDQTGSEKPEVVVDFRLIRVNTPADLVVNGRKASKNLEAPVSIGVQARAS